MHFNLFLFLPIDPKEEQEPISAPALGCICQAGGTSLVRCSHTDIQDYYLYSFSCNSSIYHGSVMVLPPPTKRCTKSLENHDVGWRMYTVN